MDNLAAAPAPVENVDRTVPAGISVPAKKGGKGAVVLAILFALIAVGLGVWLAILLLNPAKGGESKNENNTNNGGSSNQAVVSERDEDEVLNLLDEIEEPFAGYSSEKSYDHSMPIKVGDKLWAASVRTYRTRITVYDESDSNIDQMHSSAVSTLKSHGMTNTPVPQYGYPMNGEMDNESYYAKDNGLYCHIGDVNKATSGYSWFDYSCTNKNWLTDENKQLALDLLAAYNRTEDGKEYPANYISGTLTRKIQKNKAGTYEHITVGFDDAAALFYRKVGGEWKFFTATQQGIPCDYYKTDELKEAYRGEKCWDNSGKENTVK